MCLSLRGVSFCTPHNPKFPLLRWHGRGRRALVTGQPPSLLGSLCLLEGPGGIPGRGPEAKDGPLGFMSLPPGGWRSLVRMFAQELGTQHLPRMPCCGAAASQPPARPPGETWMAPNVALPVPRGSHLMARVFSIMLPLTEARDWVLTPMSHQ